MKRTGRILFSCYNEEAGDPDYLPNQVCVYDFFLDGCVPFSLHGDCVGWQFTDNVTKDGEMVIECKLEGYKKIARLERDASKLISREQLKRKLIIDSLRNGSDEQKEAVLEYLRSKAKFCSDIEDGFVDDLAFVVKELREHFEQLLKTLER